MVQLHRDGRMTTPPVDRVPTPERTGTWRLWLIVVLWVFLIAQFAVDVHFRSVGRAPYPTITMPAFSAGDVGNDGHARVTTRTIHVIDSDGIDGPVVRADALLAPLQAGPASSTLDRILGPSADLGPEPTPETVQWLKAHTERLGLTPQPAGLRIVWQPVQLNIRTGEWTAAGTATVREVRW